MNFSNYKARKETKSNPIVPIIGMILTAFFFTILIIHNISNIKYELVSLISFFLIEGVSLFFVLHINNNKKSINYKTKTQF